MISYAPPARSWVPASQLEGNRVTVYGVFWAFRYIHTPPLSTPRRAWYDHIFVGGLARQDDAVFLWECWASACCRGWNACILAANLSGLQPYTPPGILADAVEDRCGEERLAREIRAWFLRPSTAYPLPCPAFAAPEMPPLPADLASGLQWLR